MNRPNRYDVVVDDAIVPGRLPIRAYAARVGPTTLDDQATSTYRETISRDVSHCDKKRHGGRPLALARHTFIRTWCALIMSSHSKLNKRVHKVRRELARSNSTEREEERDAIFFNNKFHTHSPLCRASMKYNWLAL